MSWSCRPDVATARRAGWRCTQETETARRRAVPLLPTLARVQKTRGGPFGTLHKIGALCRRGWSHFGVTQSHDTASFWPKRSGISTAAALRHRSETETNEQRCCRLKSCCIQFCTSCPAQVDSDAGVSAGHLRLCCGAAAGPKCAEAISRRKAGTARRPRTRRPLHKLAAERHHRDAKLDDIRRDGVSVETRERNAIAVIL